MKNKITIKTLLLTKETMSILDQLQKTQLKGGEIVNQIVKSTAGPTLGCSRPGGLC